MHDRKQFNLEGLLTEEARTATSLLSRIVERSSLIRQGDGLAFVLIELTEAELDDLCAFGSTLEDLEPEPDEDAEGISHYVDL